MKEYENIFESEINRIGADSTHGATYLTLKAADALKTLAQNGADTEYMRKAALKTAEARPMMAPVFRLANDLLILLDSKDGMENAISFCDRFAGEMEESAGKVNRSAESLIQNADAVMTHSFSTLVKETILNAAVSKSFLRVFCTESRPKNEGVELAETLCEAGVDTTLITDAAAGFLCREADLLLLGADGIGEFGLVHKIGTYPMVLAARKCGVPVVVLAGKWKFWPSGVLSVKEPPKSPEEISGGGCFNVLNLYFDRTPLEYIDYIITEDAVLKPYQVLDFCKEIPLHPLLADRDSSISF